MQNVYHVELVSFLQWVQTNVPDVPIKILKNIQVMILVAAVIVTSHTFFGKCGICDLGLFQVLLPSNAIKSTKRDYRLKNAPISRFIGNTKI